MVSTFQTPTGGVPWRDDAQIIGLVGLAHATSHFTHLLLPPLFPVFMQTFGLQYSEVGLLMTVFFVISGLGQALSGFVVDRVGAFPVLMLSMALFVLSALTAAQAQGFAGLAVSAAFAGLGNAPFHPVDFSILNQRVSAARLGHAFSAHGLTGNLGWALSPVLLVGLSAWADWRVAYWVAAGLYVLVWAVLWWNRAVLQTVPHAAHTASRHSGPSFLRLPVVWWCFGFFFLSTMTFAVIQTYAVPILQKVHGIGLEMATWTLTAFMLCGAVGMLLGGLITARVRHSDRIVGGAMGVGATLLLVCASGWLDGHSTMVVLALTGVAVGIAGPNRDMMIRRATPPGATGRVYGTVYSGLDIGFALSPLVFGALMDHGWYLTTLAGASLTLWLSVLAALGVGRRTA